MKKRWMAVTAAIMSVAMVALYSVGDTPPYTYAATTGSPFAGGNGSSGSPYQIDTAAQLADMANCINAGIGNYATS
ncbi:MAG: hypothetical protein OWT27_07980, partial [Firmicutes bacterium]|nr:hypothetical protein [Bacillota bacterium]